MQLAANESIAALLEYPLGFFDAGLDLLALMPERQRRGHVAVCRHRVAVPSGLCHQVTIDREHQCLAEVDVIKGRTPQVWGNEAEPHIDSSRDLERGIGLGHLFEHLWVAAIVG